MENNDKITAEWARKEATKELGPTLQKQLDDYLGQIKTAVADNRLSINAFSLDGAVRLILENRGFQVKYWSYDSSDPRDRSYYTISW